MKYRKRPMEIEAVKVLNVCGDKNDCEILVEGGDVDWFREAMERGVGEVGGIWVLHDRLMVGTLEGSMRASAGDFIVRGIEHEIYPVKASIFEKTYEAIK